MQQPIEVSPRDHRLAPGDRRFAIVCVAGDSGMPAVGTRTVAWPGWRERPRAVGRVLAARLTAGVSRPADELPLPAWDQGKVPAAGHLATAASFQRRFGF